MASDMKFKRTIPDENFDALKFISTEGRWELGLSSMFFGRRIRFGKVGSAWCNLHYCAGDDLVFQLEVIDAVGTILSQFPETVSGGDIEAFFPSFEVKPINRDPSCWRKLQALRDAIAPIGSFMREAMSFEEPKAAA